MRFRNAFLVVIFCCFAAGDVEARPAAAPRVVVVIGIDQFPYQYLQRFAARFGRGGFRRLMEQGANFSNASYKHAVNLTGPGHSTFMSGSYGNRNGIIANTWYDLATHTTVNCVDDKSVMLVGATGNGKSPVNLIGSTFGDELRIGSGFRSKVVSISRKEVAAVLMGGKLANASYWLVDSSFVTSTYYADALPLWVQEFNRSGKVNSYFGREWVRRLPERAFDGIDRDDAPYERDQDGLGRTFPHLITGNDRQRMTSSYYHALDCSPFGNEILAAFARAAVRGEKLGMRGVTDLLCISFSSNDFVGHAYGPHSREVFEMTVRTDSVLADLLRFFDAEFGAGQYIAALTSDHGVAPMPEYILSKYPHAETGRLPWDTVTSRCEGALNARYGALAEGTKWIEKSVDRNIYFNRTSLELKHVSPDDAARVAGDALAGLRAIAKTYTREEMTSAPSNSQLDEKVKRSYFPRRSGDLFFVLKPYFFEGSGATGTTHGEPYEYSAHVPLIIMGAGVRPGTYAGEASPADLAPTLSAVTGVEFPAGREGRVLTEALK